MYTTGLRHRLFAVASSGFGPLSVGFTPTLCAHVHGVLIQPMQFLVQLTVSSVSVVGQKKFEIVTDTLS